MVIVDFVEGLSKIFGVDYDVARNIFGAAVIFVSLILAILLIWWDHDRFAIIDSIRARRNDKKYHQKQQERSRQKHMASVVVPSKTSVVEASAKEQTMSSLDTAIPPEPQDLQPTLRQWVLDASTQRVPTKELLERGEHILATYPNTLAASELQELFEHLVDEITTSYLADPNYVVA